MNSLKGNTAISRDSAPILSQGVIASLRSSPSSSLRGLSPSSSLRGSFCEPWQSLFYGSQRFCHCEASQRPKQSLFCAPLFPFGRSSSTRDCHIAQKALLLAMTNGSRESIGTRRLPRQGKKRPSSQ